MNLDFHAVGELCLDFNDAFLDAPGHFPAVLTREHHRDADDGFLSVERGRAGAELGAKLHFRHVLDEQRLDAAGEFHRQVRNVLDRLDAADRADGELLAATVDDAASGVLDVLPDEVGQFAERKVHRHQRLGLGLDDELFLVAAGLVDLGDARHGAQERLDGVLLDFAQRDELLHLCCGLVGGISAVVHAVVEDFAETGRDGRELGERAGGQPFQHALQPLGHELAGAIDVGAVLELKGHLRQAELGDGTHFLDGGQTGQFEFDGLRDELLRFLGGERGDFGVDLHLHAGDVWHGVNGQVEGRPESHAQQGRRAEQDDGALAQGEFKNGRNHFFSSIAGMLVIESETPVSSSNWCPASSASVLVSSKASTASRYCFCSST